MRGFGEVLKLAAQPKIELAPTAPDRVRSGGGTGTVNFNTSVRERTRLAEVKNAPAAVQPKSENQRLMEMYAAANARAESEEKARKEIWAQRAAERTRANNIEAKRQIIRIIRDSDALLWGQEVMELAREWGHEHNPQVYPMAIQEVRKRHGVVPMQSVQEELQRNKI